MTDDTRATRFWDRHGEWLRFVCAWLLCVYGMWVVFFAIGEGIDRALLPGFVLLCLCGWFGAAGDRWKKDANARLRRSAMRHRP